MLIFPLRGFLVHPVLRARECTILTVEQQLTVVYDVYNGAVNLIHHIPVGVFFWTHRHVINSFCISICICTYTHTHTLTNRGLTAL